MARTARIDAVLAGLTDGCLTSLAALEMLGRRIYRTLIRRQTGPLEMELERCVVHRFVALVPKND